MQCKNKKKQANHNLTLQSYNNILVGLCSAKIRKNRQITTVAAIYTVADRWIMQCKNKKKQANHN